MARQLKCPVCSKLNNREDTVKHTNGRYYCPDCLEQQRQNTQKNTDGWEELYNYICELTGNKPTGKMYKQLSDFRKEPYNYTNEGMRLTLYYFHELMNNPIREDTLGIIPYVYEDAKKLYIENMNTHLHNAQTELSNKIIRIKVKPTSTNFRKKLIDFEELEVLNE